MSEIIIAGGGLCGSLLGAFLAQNDHQITVLEKRSDVRLGQAEAGRSINLALSSRGIKALELIGFGSELKDISIPMPVRCLHQKDGSIQYVPYSGRAGEYINSISRSGLNAVLLDYLEKCDSASVHFLSEVTKVDFDENKVHYRKNNTDHFLHYDYLFGTDGAGSILRSELFKNKLPLHQLKLDFLDYGYKELHIEPVGINGFAIEKNALHIWPRGHLMMIALPNLDGSFTMTLFLPLKGPDSFEQIDRETGIIRYFEKYFPDVLDKIPSLESQYAMNPIGQLGTLKCNPWNYKNSCLMGDAAHAITPFYGQGMNCAFEDVLILSQLMKEEGNLNTGILERFYQQRKSSADAIADLAIDNFYEMRDHTANPVFLRKRQLETTLEKTFPDYFSKYSMVTFRTDISYREAMIRGRMQDEWLMNYSNQHPEITESPAEIFDQLKHYMNIKLKH
ncbi:MAG: FAD-dependent monooxygenase [Saprospiraceae bacterium]|nr:FAD-dependent monooxygenase [Saprospiraceae bacterium]